MPAVPEPVAPERLRIALLSYRGDPFCGGQGVYVRHLSRELVALGHHVEVLAGDPLPVVVDGVVLTPLRSLDLYRQPDPFRVPTWSEFRDSIDVLEFATMCTAGFPEPRTFSLRAARELRRRRHEFDVVHDNQSLGSGLLRLLGVLPLVVTVHHPIQVDRRVDLAGVLWWRQAPLRRWYGFTRMQQRVARRLPSVLTVSDSSARDVHRELAVPDERLHVVPVGVDPGRFHPRPDVPVVPDSILTTASADVPVKGLAHLLEAVAKLRVERPGVTLTVVGRQRPGSTAQQMLDRYGLRDAVTFASGVDDDELIRLICSAAVVAVPSLYEGFSLPAVEAMACARPLVATTGGALPEVVGTDGETGRLVPPGDAEALRAAIQHLFDDPATAARIGAAGRDRVLARFTWAMTAQRTAELYRRAIGDQRC